jgi:hypothetical protein
VTQTTLSAMVGVTQPRVSQVLRTLIEHDAVAARPDGYLANRRRVIDLYLANHTPSLSQPEAPWYSLASQREAVTSATNHANDEGARIAVSADLGPDLLAPWRHPTLTVIYCSRSLDLTAAGFIRAEGRVDATVLIRPTADTTLLAAFEPWPRQILGVALTDPLQQLWDLHELGGHDRLDAARHLTTAILKRTLSEARASS